MTQEVEKISVVRDHRVETGVVQFNDDWPGVFIRGDCCRAYAMALKDAIERMRTIAKPLLNQKEKNDLGPITLTIMQLEDLGRLLDSSCVSKDIRLWKEEDDKPA